jgi:hypothetical protein
MHLDVSMLPMIAVRAGPSSWTSLLMIAKTQVSSSHGKEETSIYSWSRLISRLSCRIILIVSSQNPARLM